MHLAWVPGRAEEKMIGDDETGRRWRFYIPNKTDQTHSNSEDTKALVANLGKKERSGFTESWGSSGTSSNNPIKGFFTTCPGPLGKCVLGRHPCLMSNYIFTDWASARFDVSSDNLDRWLIFYVSSLLQSLLSWYHIGCVRNSAKTWHFISAIWLTCITAARLIIVTGVPKIFAILRPRYRMLLMFLPLHTLPIHVSCLVHPGSSPALTNAILPSVSSFYGFFFCYIWDLPFYILNGYCICKDNW